MNTAPRPGDTARGVTLVYAQVLPVMAIVSLFPAIPRLFQAFGGAPRAALLIPALVTIPSLACALVAPFAGMLTDRFGRRRSLVGGLWLYVIAGLVPLFAADLGTILASRAALGIAEAFVITTSSALIGDYFGEGRHRWVAWVGVVTSIAGTVLIAVGGALADVSWRGPFAIYLAAIPTLVLALLFIDEPVAAPAGASAAPVATTFPWRASLVLGPVTLVASLLYYVEPLNIARVLDQQGAGSATRIGLIQAATSLAYIGGALVYRRFHALGPGRLLGLAGVAIGAGLLVIGLGRTWPVSTLGAAIQQVGAGMVIPILLAWGQALLPTEQRGRGMGIWATAFFCGTFLCSPLVDAVEGAIGDRLHAIAALGVLALLLAALAPRFIATSRPARNEVPA